MQNDYIASVFTYLFALLDNPPLVDSSFGSDISKTSSLQSYRHTQNCFKSIRIVGKSVYVVYIVHVYYVCVFQQMTGVIDMRC